MSQNGQPQLSLLSLSIAAANAAPISASPVAESAPRIAQVHTTNGAAASTTKHRRLSSAGRSRRRLSDARDAATRPFPSSLQTASASLAALSLSSPTVSQRQVPGGAQPIQVPRTTTTTKGQADPNAANTDDAPSLSHTPLASNSVNVSKQGRKRGTIFTCESCSKVYRHPSCLIKHRWEHTPQWREASKFVLSKHQQVQLLEAAAILSHLSPSSASLPEDRSLWPSFLSGGLVPPPASTNIHVGSIPTTAAVPWSNPTTNENNSFPVSISVPASTLLGSHIDGLTEPRLHDYAFGVAETNVARIDTGTLSVPTAPTDGESSPGSMPATAEDDALNLLALRSASVSMSVPLTSSSHSHTRSQSYSHLRSRVHTHSHSHSLSLSDALPKEGEQRSSIAYEYGFASGSKALGNGHDYKFGPSSYAYTHNPNGGWSLPRSSVRSKSVSTRSRSGSQSVSESRSDDDEAESLADLEEDGERTKQMKLYGSRMSMWEAEDGDADGDGGVARLSLREDAEEDAENGKGHRPTAQTWDGMEMEMEMEMG